MINVREVDVPVTFVVAMVSFSMYLFGMAQNEPHNKIRYVSPNREIYSRLHC